MQSGSTLASDLVVGKPNSSREMTISKQEQQVVLQQIFRKVRDQNEGKNGESLHLRRNVLYAAMLFLWLSSQDEATIQKQLRLRFFLPQVDRKQLTRVYLLACHDLSGDLGQRPTTNSWSSRGEASTAERSATLQVTPICEWQRLGKLETEDDTQNSKCWLKGRHCRRNRRRRPTLIPLFLNQLLKNGSLNWTTRELGPPNMH